MRCRGLVAAAGVAAPTVRTGPQAIWPSYREVAATGDAGSPDAALNDALRKSPCGDAASRHSLPLGWQANAAPVAQYPQNWPLPDFAII